MKAVVNFIYHLYFQVDQLLSHIFAVVTTGPSVVCTLSIFEEILDNGTEFPGYIFCILLLLSSAESSLTISSEEISTQSLLLFSVSLLGNLTKLEELPLLPASFAERFYESRGESRRSGLLPSSNLSSICNITCSVGLPVAGFFFLLLVVAPTSSSSTDDAAILSPMFLSFSSRNSLIL